ncbi:MAG: protoporphyrinogen oxidase, partial [Planctomycetota bacterium]
AINSLLKDMPNLALIGNYLEGVSLDDCIKKAKSAVGKLVGEAAKKSAERGVA